MRSWFLTLLLAFTMFVIGGANQSAVACEGAQCSHSQKMQAQVPGVIDPQLPDGTKASPIHAENSCDFAFNGVCDEPSKCKVGTDSYDCGPQSLKSKP